MADNITAAELQTALSLKALAYKDSASGSIEIVNGVENHTYTPEGSVSVTLSQTATPITSSGAITPKGTVTGRVTAAGTVTAPTITVTPSTATVQHIADVGSLPSLTPASYTAPSLGDAVTSGFAVNGMIANVAEGTETLTFTNAATAQAVTDRGAFNAGSYTEAQFSAGSLPTIGEEQTVVTGTETTIAASFAGNEVAVSVSGSYDKAAVQSASFSGTQATIKHTVTKENKTVTVS